MNRWTRIGLTALAAGAILLISVIYVGSRTSAVRERFEAALSERLESKVGIGSLAVSLFPTMRVYGDDLEVRHRGRTDVPPLIEVQRFAAEGGFIGLWTRGRHLRSVELDGLKLHIPPRERKDAGEPGQEDEREEDDSPGEAGKFEKVFIDRIISTDAELVLIPRRRDKDPRVFPIHKLTIESVGAGNVMPFRATLTNPVPRGLIETTGNFGPWDRHEPSRTPIAGLYTFTDVNLATIKGISGTLRSHGDFKGPLEQIETHGETETPDFGLSSGGHPVALTTKSVAIVDGTDGNTYLQSVEARFLRTQVLAYGSVTKTRGVKGRTVTLAATIDDGRIEDLLYLATKAEKPLMVGDVRLTASFVLPPGEPDVIERLDLKGQFGVLGAKFANAEVRQKLAEMSHRARGKGGEEAAATVTSDLRGHFSLSGGVLRFSALTFTIPGAAVHLAGWYDLRHETMDFDGTLRMQATISEAAGGGLKSAVLKVVDPFFRKKGAGAVLPIRITGTRQHPKFGLDVMKALTPK